MSKLVTNALDPHDNEDIPLQANLVQVTDRNVPTEIQASPLRSYARALPSLLQVSLIQDALK